MAATQINAVSIAAAEQTAVDLTTGTPVDAVNGNVTPNSGRLRLLVQNTSATAADTVSVTRTATLDGAALAAHTYPIAANKTLLIGPFPAEVFGSSLLYQATAVTTKVIPVVD